VSGLVRVGVNALLPAGYLSAQQLLCMVQGRSPPWQVTSQAWNNVAIYAGRPQDLLTLDDGWWYTLAGMDF